MPPPSPPPVSFSSSRCPSSGSGEPKAEPSEARFSVFWFLIPYFLLLLYHYYYYYWLFWFPFFLLLLLLLCFLGARRTPFLGVDVFRIRFQLLEAFFLLDPWRKSGKTKAEKLPLANKWTQTSKISTDRFPLKQGESQEGVFRDMLDAKGPYIFLRVGFFHLLRTHAQ